MTLFARSVDWVGASAGDLLPRRDTTGANTYRTISDAAALRNSVVWACLRIRADLISSMPLDVYREAGGFTTEVPPSQFLVNPDPGQRGGMAAWLYASQFDLDRGGNTYGIITRTDSFGLPQQVELQQAAMVTVMGKGPSITKYRIAGKSYEPEQIWHERQFVVPGVPVGLSPTAAAAMSINQHLTAQEFVTQWFGGSAIPKARMKSTTKKVTTKEALDIRNRYETMVNTGGLFVHGNDWEFSTIQSNAADTAFFEAMNSSNADICRYYGVPGDIIDVPMQGSAITYASITQRNLQLLIMNLGPAVTRRESALTEATPKPRFVKLNAAAAVLRMDPTSQAESLVSQVAGRTLAPSEARAILDRAPFTEEQYVEFDRLGFTKAKPEPGKQMAV